MVDRVPVDYDPFADLESAPSPSSMAALGVVQGPQLSPYQSSIRDRLARALMGGERASDGRRKAVEGLVGSTGLGNTGMSVADLTPLAVPFAYNEARPGEGAVQLGMAMVPGAPRGIRAYHGSPHSFDRFDLSKIGTGEGAQVYGHGLYFAENEGVARSYRDALSSNAWITPNGQIIDRSLFEHPTIRVMLDKNQGNVDTALERAAALLKTSNEQTGPLLIKDINRLQEIKAAGGMAPNKGSMYEVQINANPEHFLDWDKPVPYTHVMRNILDEQTQRALANSSRWVREDARVLARNVDNPNLTGEEAYRNLKELNAQNSGNWNDRTGAIRNPAPAASQILDDSGVPGIRYLDAGSRGAGAGTSNYVVFNDKLIDILRKYGIGALAFMPPATAAAIRGQMTPVDHDPFAEVQ